MNKIKNSVNKINAVLINIALAILFLTINASAQTVIFSERQLYNLGETVTIQGFNISEQSEIRLMSPESSYKLMGDLSQPIDFIPTVAGFYSIYVEKFGTIIANNSFQILIPDPINRTIETLPLEKVIEALGTDNDFNYSIENSSEILDRANTFNYNLTKINNGSIGSTQETNNLRTKKSNSAMKIKNYLSQDKDSDHIIDFKSINRGIMDENQLLSLPPSEKFDIEIKPQSGNVNNFILKGVRKQNASEIELGLEDLNPESISINKKISLKAFAVDPTQMNFDYGILNSTAIGTELWKCKDWNFTLQICTGNWVQIMNLTPGQEYSILIDAFDPGFTETSPSTGTADAGGVVNIVNANYNNGNFASTQVNDNTFWALGRSNGGAQQLDSHGYLNFTFNVSIINYSSIYQVTDLQLNVSYCHSADVTAPTTCSALLTGVDFGNNSVEIYNYSSNTYFTLGLLQNRSGTEGINSYNLSGGIFDFIDPVQGSVNIRMWSNFTITVNGRDAVLAVDYAPLTLSLDSIYPSINFTLPTPNTGSIITLNYTHINITANDTRLKNISLSVYDSFGSIVYFNSSIASTQLFSIFYNVSNLPGGTYFYNATTCDEGNLCNSTETRNITLDLGAPGINFVEPTPNDGQILNLNYFTVNVSAQDPNFVNLTLRIYNQTNEIIYDATTTQTNITINITGLTQGTYRYNATACDSGTCGNSQTRNVTIDLTNPTLEFNNPTFRDNMTTNLTFLQINALSQDQHINNISLTIIDQDGNLIFQITNNSNIYVNITNLEEGTYEYFVLSCDQAGNCIQSPNRKFTSIKFSNIDYQLPGTREALFAYTENGVNTPRYRIWNGTSFGTEQSANDVGATSEWLALKSNPTKYEYILATADTGDDINVQFYSYLNNGTLCWNNGTSCDFVREFETVASTGSYQKVDVAYSQLTGMAMLVYTDTSTTPDVARFITWNGSAWSTEATVPQIILTGNMEQVKLAERPNSNEIALAMTDANDDVNFMIWNGSDWGCEPASIQRNTLGATAGQTVDITYEQESGDFFAAITDTAASDFYYSVKPADTCIYNVSVSTTLTVAAPEMISVSSQKSSDYIMISMRDNGGNDVQSLVWNGTDMLNASLAEIDAYGAEASPNLLIGTGWTGTKGTGIVLYADNTNLTGLNYMKYNKTSDTWFGPATGLHTSGTEGITNFSSSERNFIVKSYYEENKIIALIQDESNDLWAKIFNYANQSWLDADSGTAIETESISGTLESMSYDFAWNRAPQFPSINFTFPTENRTYSSDNHILLNASAIDTNLQVVLLQIFNSSGILVNSNETYETQIYANFTNLQEDIYFFNATACDTSNRCNTTELRNVTIDLNSPNVTLLVPNSYVHKGNVSFRFTISDISLKNATLYINSSGTFIANTTINTSLSNTEQEINITLDNGVYSWNILACDMVDRCSFDLIGGPQSDGNFTINVTLSDLIVTDIEFNVSDEDARQGMNITINATIQNIGPVNLTNNFTVQFFYEIPGIESFKIGPNITINYLESGQSTTVNATFIIPKGGPNNIYAIVDPDNNTNGSIEELIETNNAFNTSLNIVGYHFFYGNISNNIILGLDNNWTLLTYANITNTTGHVFVASDNSTISFTSLAPIGRTTTNLSATNDFTEVDFELNMTIYQDSTNIVFTDNTGTPHTTKTFNIFGNNITNVAIINSTNSSAFTTGILWDYSDGGIEFNGNQDIIFITEIQQPTQGKYGIYNYEIRVPVFLQNFKGGSAVAFYTELTG